ncbi:MAG: N-6 DNA methylase [Chloroflexi bacterium]|nr:N-6 DNA methylase [Chloroflexota bacterium]
MTETAKQKAQQDIANLVTKYQNLPPSNIKKHTEADTRRVFLLPLFQALGWDVYSRDEVAEEVKTASGRVDYVFKLHGVSQFYLEAKSLRTELTRPEHIKQAITYAYNKGITWAVLSNFDGLQVYNAQTGRQFISLTHSKYLTDFDDLWLLSKESLGKNALNERAEKYGALPPRLGIEQRLYTQLRQWREELFTQLHHYNSSLDYNQIDEVIERLFNRLIFIRTCEDRRIEDSILLASVREWQSGGHKEQLIERLKHIFREFDGYYDSDLFAPHLTDQVFIESVTIEKIIVGLYEIPGGMASYDFSLIDADVLGTVYEQYLGHVATVVKQRAKEAQARMDLGFPADVTFELTAKKQHRKEQGIYYTPRFVTDYIVEQTVGRFLKEHSHNEVLNLKILDPACGSGSFLIRAYDELLNYHADKRGKPVSGLDQWERLPILTGNVFGVDLDMQAVEIACLNLLLRSLARRDTLPPLAGNIRCGNSLISGSEDELKAYFGKDWREKKPFDWDKEFADIMAKGGFDIVIGNPPYVGFHGFTDEKDYLRDKYQSAQGRFDVYLPFIERGTLLLKEGGLLGFICPTNFMKRQHGQALRKLLKNNYKILQIIDFQHEQIFEQALNYTCIIIVEKSKPSTKHFITYIPERIDGEGFSVKQYALQDDGWVFRDKIHERIVAKIAAQPNISIGDLTESISEGIVTGKNDVFLLPINIASKLGLEKELLKAAIQGKQIQRYFNEQTEFVVIYPYQTKENRTVPISEQDMVTLFPITWKYLSSNKKNLVGRQYFDESPKAWYELWCERSFFQQASNKIIVPELASCNRFAYCDKSIFYLDTACGIIPKKKDSKTYLYLLGLLNSSLLEFYYKQTTVPKAGGFFIYKTMFLKKIPIRRIDFSNPAEKKMHDDLVSLANKMLELNKRLAPIRNTPCNEHDELLREIERTDKEIDNLVYDLYGLSEEDRRIVSEGNVLE